MHNQLPNYLTAYKSWRWDGTDWHTGKILAVRGKKLTAPDWKPNMPADHCGNGFHCSDSPEGCLLFVNLGRIAQVRVPPPFQVGDKIRSKHLVVTRWLSDAEIADVATKHWGADYSEIITRLRTICRSQPRSREVTPEQKRLLEQWDSVSALVGASVRASVSALVGHICRPWVPAWKVAYPFQPGVDLWLSGCVPSFDGKVWRLHGEGGKVIYTRKQEVRRSA